MKNIVEFLSGNIPGGISLYLLILITIFFVIYFIYRTSEIFSTRHFKRWLAISWLSVTIVYVLLWIKNPPNSITDRYAVIFIPQKGAESRWISNYLNFYFSEIVQPYEDKYTYYFPYYWFYESDLNIDSLDTRSLFRLLNIIPVEKYVLGRVIQKNSRLRLILQAVNKGRTVALDSVQVNLENKARISKNFNPIKMWISRFIKIKTTEIPTPPFNRLFMKGIENFYKGNYELANKEFKQVLNIDPDNVEVLKWKNFVDIRQAIREKGKEKKVNPFAEQKALPFNRLARYARNQLFQIMKKAPDFYSDDDILLNMIAESYLVEEKFGDAALFLKNAYVNNPFNIYVLENLTYLYPTRYRELGFRGEIEILERIMFLCPVDLRILLKYVDAVVATAPIDVSQVRRGEKIVQKYLILNPNSVPAWSALGKLYLQNLQLEAAQKAFLKADSLDKNDPVIKYNLGIVSFKKGDLKGAENYFKRAVQINDYLNAHLYLGFIYQNEGKYEEALKEYRYRVAHKTGENDFYAYQAMKGIQKVLQLMNNKE